MPRVRAISVTGLLAACWLATACGRKVDPPADEVPPAVRIAPEAIPPGAGAKVDLRDTTRKRLRKIGWGISRFADASNFLPAGVVAKGGAVGLSWRVQILPYVGEKALYEQFKFDEPWDSENNEKLIEKMPEVFASPGRAAPAGRTHLRTFTGQYGFIYDPVPVKGAKPDGPRFPGVAVRGRPFSDITDGTSYAFMVVEATEPVVWTKPDELSAQPKEVGKPGSIPIPKLGGPFPDGFHALMCDAQVHFFPHTLKAETVRALVTVNANDTPGADATAMIEVQSKKWAAIDAGVPAQLPDAKARRVAADNLMKLARAAEEYEKDARHLPAGLLCKPDSVGLSWRVQLLPYLGEERLYLDFRLKEVWDSEHNKPLLARMPAVFASAGAAPVGHTLLRMTQGPEGMIPAIGSLGESWTPPNGKAWHVYGRSPYRAPRPPILWILEGGEAVPWTKPEGIDCDAKKPLPKLGGAFAGGFHAVTGGGRAYFVRETIPEPNLRALLALAPDEPWPLDEAIDHLQYAVIPPERP